MPAATQPAVAAAPRTEPATAPQPQPASPSVAQPAPSTAGSSPQPQVAKAPAASAAAAPPAPAAAPQPARPGRFRRFVRSVFSHLLFAGISVAAVLGYLYHDPILRDVSNTVCADKVLGQWMGKPSASVAAKPTAPATAAPAASTTLPQPVPSPAATPVATPAAVASVPVVAAVPSAPANAAVERAPAAPRPAAVEKPSASTGATTIAPPVPAAVTPRVEKAPSDGAPPAPPAKPAPATVSTAPDKPAVEASSGVKVAAVPADAKPGADANSLEQGWAAARKAFADGKPEAVAAYHDLAKRFSDNPDLTGELGNILFQQGKLDEAGDQFLETGRRLIARNHHARAACLAEVLQKFAPEKAKELAARAGVTCPVTATR